MDSWRRKHLAGQQIDPFAEEWAVWSENEPKIYQQAEEVQPNSGGLFIGSQGARPLHDTVSPPTPDVEE